ncbi:MAG: recombinase family protein [Bacteroidales bacterium]|nr:recombinase family protein [Bacteroidales bacterium]
MKTAIIYARVSSSGSLESRQSTERQVIDLTDYANRNSMTISKTFEEHISGAKRNEERAVLTECIEYAISNRVDVILFSELSRCGRAVWEVLDTIRTLKDNGINAYFQKEGLSLFSEDGRENIYLAIMISVLSSASQIERENLIFRLKSGRKVYVDKNLAATGKSGLGRKVGYRKPVETKKEEYKEALKLLKAGYPIRKVAKLTDVSESTVKRLKKEFAIC